MEKEPVLRGYSWNLGEYMPHTSQAERKKLTLYDAYSAYRLIPAPPCSESGRRDDFILLAQETHEIKYVLFYLHENERYFNDRISTFLTSETDWFSPERFMDLKLECRIEVLKRFPAYDPDRGTTFITYIHRYITDTLLRFRMQEEFYSFDSLQEYGWEFLFLGANIDAVETAAHFGIMEDRAVTFHNDAKGQLLNCEVVSKTMSAFRACAPVGREWKDEIEKDYKLRKARR